MLNTLRRTVGLVLLVIGLLLIAAGLVGVSGWRYFADIDRPVRFLVGLISLVLGFGIAAGGLALTRDAPASRARG